MFPEDDAVNHSVSRRLLAWIISAWASARTASSLAVGVIIYCGLRHAGSATLTALAASVPFMCVVCAGGLLNDYYDRDRDAVDKPWRAIPAGRLRPGVAAALGCLLLSLSVSFAVVQGHYSHVDLVILGSAAIGVVFYNFIVKYAGMLKGLYVGLLCILPLLVVLGHSTIPAMPLCFGLTLFVWGRETLMDTLDVRGDAAVDSHTLAICIGQTRSTAIGFALLISGLAIFVCTIDRRLAPMGTAVQAFAVVLTVGLAMLWRHAPPMRRIFVYLMWVPLALEIGAFIHVL